MRSLILNRKNILLLLVSLLSFKHLQGQQANLEEEVYAFTSEEYVMPGEHLWVEARVLHNGTATPSVVLYMELLNREGVPVIQEMTPIRDGLAEGYLVIHELLPSDYYLLRVYTKVSPYFSVEKGIHHQLIAVINPAIPPKINQIPYSENLPLPANSPEQAFPLIGLPTDGSLNTGNPVTLTLPEGMKRDISVAVSYVGDLPPIPKISPSELYRDPIYRQIPQPEIFGHVIQGRVLSAPIDTTLTYYLSAHGKASKLMISKPLPDGRLLFESAEFQQFDYVIVQSENPDSPLDFVLDSPFWPEKPHQGFSIPPLLLSENLYSTLQDRLLANQTGGYFFPEKPSEPQSYPPFLVEDFSYLLDDYNRFDDMATVIREYVPTVLVRRENRKTIFKNVNKPAADVFQQNPLILIDAMPVLDSDVFARFNPKGIKKMDIVNRQFYLDHKEFEGVINLTSFENDFGKFELPKHALFIAYKGIQLPKDSRLGAVINKDRRAPDFRSLRAWCGISGTASCTFDTGLLTGKFILRYMDWDNPRTPSAVKLMEVR